MSESMIERVARALHEKMCEQDVNGYLAAQLDCAALARAAIEAMREPTDAQLTAAEDIVVGWDDFACGDGNIYLGIPGYPDKAKRAWTELVDAALNEQVAG